MSEIARRDQLPQEASATPHMTTEDVARRLAEIHAQRGLVVPTHGMQDDLYRDVLAAIAAGAPDAELLAGAALQVEHPDFARWCA